MIHFIRLIRPINLIIIALTMYLIRHFVIGAFLDDLNHAYGTNFELLFSDIDFFLLVLSTVMIAAAGNIINDYFDLRADRINKPEKIIVHRHVNRRVAMLVHSVLNLIAVGIGFYVAWRTGFWPLAVVHIFSTSLLWFYSLYLKRKFLIGNITIALLSGLVPLIVGAAEIPMLWDYFLNNTVSPQELIWKNRALTSSGYLSDVFLEGSTLSEFIETTRSTMKRTLVDMAISTFGFAFFAFWTTLVREIQKDAADIKGDKAMNCRTVPIVWGLAKTKRFIILLIAILVIILGLVSQFYLVDAHFISTIWLMGPVAITMLYSASQTASSRGRTGFLRASSSMKLAMLFGVLYGVVLWYQINYIIHA